MKTSAVDQLTLEKVAMAPLAEEDVEALFEVARNPASIEDYQHVPSDVEDVAYWVEAALDGGEYAWTIRPVNDPDVIVGMVSVEPENDHIAEIGYFVDEAFQGRGYGSQAIQAAVDWIFDNTTIHRVKAGITVGNPASRRAAEKAGFAYEGRSRQDWLWDDQWNDSLNYARTRTQSGVTQNHDPDRTDPEFGCLVAVNASNVDAVLKLNVTDVQKQFVAPNAVSLAQGAHTSGSWYRGIVNQEECLVGFMMLFDPTLEGAKLDEDTPDDGVYVWRLMVDREHQGRSYGSSAIKAARAYTRGRGLQKLYVSAVDQPDGPTRFYEKIGFTRTGRIVDGEIELLVELTGSDGS